MEVLQKNDSKKNEQTKKRAFMTIGIRYERNGAYRGQTLNSTANSE